MMKVSSITEVRRVTKDELKARKEARVPKPFSITDTFAFNEAMRELHESAEKVIFKPIQDAYQAEINHG